MKRFILILLTISPVFAFSQINIGGEPYSYRTEFKTVLSEDIQEIKLPLQDNAELIKEADLNYSKDKPWQFGKNFSVNIDIKNEALKENLKNGSLYRMKISSENAESLNLRFSNYKLPKGAALYMYSSDKKQLLGGFTEQNNQNDLVFATGLIFYNEIILEYFEPDHTEFDGILIIDQITHGFRNIAKHTKSFGTSGDCNLNVACDDGTWINEIRSVCMLVVGSSGLCTGSLINNTQFDGTPYVLTADHCNFNHSSLIFWFNWESETCDDPMIVPDHDFISGCVQLAESSNSDFSLLRMNFEPPSDYNVYYAGWDASDNPSLYSVGIHHPDGDIKKISYDDDPSVSNSYLGFSGIANSHWKVIWDRNTTTEGGSSGSPLFNENKEIIGQLHGGYASCNNLDEADWYGKFSYSWDYGSDASTRLKDWLDPFNSGVTELEGYDPNIPIADNDVQLLNISEPNIYTTNTNTITPTFLIRNRGFNNLTSCDLKYSIDMGEEFVFSWSGNLTTFESTIISFDEISISKGEHMITSYTENPNAVPDENTANDTLSKTFTVYETIFDDDFETAQIWKLNGEFEINDPEGLGGSSGNPDPEHAFSGINVLGTDLSGLGDFPGDYEPALSNNEEYAESPVIDCRNYSDTKLSIQRWLNTEGNDYDKALIQIKTDEDWISLFQNSIPYFDSQWTKEIIDISEFADRKKILIRFVLGSTDGFDQYSGWNIDNFCIAGIKDSNVPDLTEDIQIYPNPASSYFYIESSQSISKANLTLSDINGKIVYSRKLQEGEFKISENSEKRIIMIYPKEDLFGLFILKIETDIQQFVKKIVIM